MTESASPTPRRGTTTPATIPRIMADYKCAGCGHEIHGYLDDWSCIRCGCATAERVRHSKPESAADSTPESLLRRVDQAHVDALEAQLAIAREQLSFRQELIESLRAKIAQQAHDLDVCKQFRANARARIEGLESRLRAATGDYAALHRNWDTLEAAVRQMRSRHEELVGDLVHDVRVSSTPLAVVDQYAQTVLTLVRDLCCCIDCHGARPEHDPHCTYMQELHGTPPSS